MSHLNESCVDAYTTFLNLQEQSYYYLMGDTVKPLRHKGWEALNVYAEPFGGDAPV
jgi:hypothetical protein